MPETAAEAADRIVRHAGTPSVSDYAAISNCKTLALVARNGSIDWMCVPHFSAPSLFAAPVDAEKGGRYVVQARNGRAGRRRYLDGSNVLCTETVADGGRLRTTDFMVLSSTGEMQAEHLLVRTAECITGEVELEILFQPRPDFARRMPRLSARGELGWHFQDRALAGYLKGELELEPVPGAGALYGRRRLRAGERCATVLALSNAEPAVLAVPEVAGDLLAQTQLCWQRHSARCSYHGPYRDAVLRSSLTLKLLDSSLTGAMIAAGPTSLPESFDGDRNWDYRYCWLRDAGQVLQSFADAGYREEALSFLQWMLHATRLTRPHLQPVYDIFGEARLVEFTLDHLDGHLGHGPVRIGNKAREQLQMDVYGDVIIAACDYVCAGGRLDRRDRELLAGFGRVIQEHWRKPDHGIWEARKPRRHNTHSKLMCWAGLNSLLRLNAVQPMRLEVDAVRDCCEQIRADIDRNAFDAGNGHYVAQYDSRQADASLLLIPRLGFLDADDPRVEATRRFVEQRLDVDGKVYRYPPGGDYDGLEGHEHPFGLCSFWMVECLARQRRNDAARDRFERLLALSNDVGLYAEQLHVDTGAAVGNVPQAFTHVGLITAALELDRPEEARSR